MPFYLKTSPGLSLTCTTSQYIAGTIDAPCSNLKIVKLGKRQFGVALTALANPDGTLHNPEKMPKKHTTGMLYRSLFVRHWDSYIEPARQSIWYGTLMPRKEDGSDEARTTYFLSPLTNALKGSRLESPIPPDGGRDHFDISPKGLIFIAKDPHLNPALHTKCNVYLVRLSNFLETTPELLTVLTREYNGAMASPVFSKDGTKAAFLVMRQDGYEADKNHIVVMPDVSWPARLVDLLSSTDGSGRWHRSPTTIIFGADGDDQLYLLAENYGNKLVYTVSLHPTANELPKAYTDSGSVADIKILPKGDVFLSATSFIENSIYHLVPHGQKYQAESTSPTSHARNKYGLTKDQVSEIWFKAAGHNPDTEDKVQAWVVKPSSFDPKKKYPLAFMCHGGPQGAWSDAWSTRWNAAVFAEQGYVVVLPNPTGSTGFGQRFTDDIKEQWGGLAYRDLENCFAYIEDNMDYVDTDRAVALGASFGGYCMNWFQGQALGKKLKALVCHDGIFSTVYELATEELYFVNHDLGGPYWDNKEKWMKWDPAQYIDRWTTPMLVIHSERDYRLTMADGLAAFNVLQSRGIESELLVFKDEVSTPSYLAWLVLIRVIEPLCTEAGELARLAFGSAELDQQARRPAAVPGRRGERGDTRPVVSCGYDNVYSKASHHFIHDMTSPRKRSQFTLALSSRAVACVRTSTAATPMILLNRFAIEAQPIGKYRYASNDRPDRTEQAANMAYMSVCAAENHDLRSRGTTPTTLPNTVVMLLESRNQNSASAVEGLLVGCVIWSVACEKLMNSGTIAATTPRKQRKMSTAVCLVLVDLFPCK